MNQFSHVPADGVAGVAQAASVERVLARSDDPDPGPFVAIERPPLSLVKIEELQGGGLRLGAFVTNADIAYDPRVMRHYPLLVSAILAGATPQSCKDVTIQPFELVNLMHVDFVTQRRAVQSGGGLR